MKTLSTVLAVSALAVVSGQAQTLWNHERLSNESLFAGQSTNCFINANGDVAFTASTLSSYQSAWKYHSGTGTLINLNQAYLGTASTGTSYGINASGEVAWVGETASSLSINADGHDFYAPLFPPDTNRSHVTIRGIDDAGDPFWLYQKSGVSRVFQGGMEISGGATISAVMLYGTIGKGDTLYRATDSAGNINLYKNGTNFTAPLLGDLQLAPEGVLGVNGSVLWAALGSTTDGRFDMFLNDQNLTKGLFPTMKGGHPEAINSSEQYLWIRYDMDNSAHMMKGMEDLTAELPELGIDGAGQLRNYINDNGDVFWEAVSSQQYGFMAILNGKNLTTDIVGIPTDFHMTGLDGSGNGVWYASGPKVPQRSVFVNQFNLSADAYGGFNYGAAAGLAVGVNGQVLWTAQDPDGTSSVWLSTPVPEPGITVPAMLVAAGLWRRRPIMRRA